MFFRRIRYLLPFYLFRYLVLISLFNTNIETQFGQLIRILHLLEAWCVDIVWKPLLHGEATSARIDHLVYVLSVLTVLPTLLECRLELSNGLLTWLLRESNSILETTEGRTILSLSIVGTHHELLGASVGHMRIEHLNEVIVPHRISLRTCCTDRILMAPLRDSKVLESFARVCIGLTMHCREISNSDTCLSLSLHAC